VQSHPVFLQAGFALDEGELLGEEGGLTEVEEELLLEEVGGRPASGRRYFLVCSKIRLRKPGETSTSTSLGTFAFKRCRS
jgi:hypothetical protein